MLILGALALSPAAASAAPRFGYGDQSPAMFGDARWQKLPLKDVRRLVDWDTNHRKSKIAALDAWMVAAHDAGARPLLAIDRSWSVGMATSKPTVRQYRALLGWLKGRYPWWNELTPWNEANFRLQPTWRNPKLAAAYWRAATAVCEDCIVTSPVILAGQSGTAQWVKDFKRYTGNRVRLWAVHSYGDHNRFTDTMLRTTIGQLPGTLWVTEAAGWVKFMNDDRWPYNERRAAQAINQIFTTATKYQSRIKRWYFYQWLGNYDRAARWDSGVLNFDGTPRKGYGALVRGLKRSAAQPVTR